jgi:hypothetical protein
MIVARSGFDSSSPRNRIESAVEYNGWHSPGGGLDAVLLAGGGIRFRRADFFAATCGGLRCDVECARVETTSSGMRVRASDAPSERSIPSLGSAPGASIAPRSEAARVTVTGTSTARELIDLAERMGIPTSDAVRRVLEHLDGDGYVALPLRNPDESGVE